MLRVALPVSVTVTVWAALVTPIGVEKVRFEAERPTAGALGGGGLAPPPPPPPQATEIAKPRAAKNTLSAAGDFRRHTRVRAARKRAAHGAFAKTNPGSGGKPMPANNLIHRL